MKKCSIITIERQYASGGSEIGRLAAEKLGIKCYGHEILDIAAERIGMSREYLREIEESATSSMLYSMIMAPNASMRTTDMVPPADKLFIAETEVINEIADRGESCIIIGRAAGHVLEDREDCLRVFIYSDKDARVRRAVNEYGVSEKEAGSVLKRYDKRRANFYNMNCALGWEDREAYDLMLDSSKLGIDGCVAVILAAAGNIG
ncbi:MAG: cytidylate kinase-like family protein [Clostridia bacterium]|nr:cytidylate kinase-like family protein [Clostridia bacterium]